MLELLFLLLPIAAGYGWIMGRNSIRNDDSLTQQSIYSQYTKSLHFLLDDQKDEAIENLIEFLEVNSNTVETHLMLANLFRRRGEFDKAIKIHELLLEHPLDTEVTNTIKFELALDYVKAGIYNQAESLFLKVKLTCQDTVYIELLHLYQITKDWDKGLRLISSIKDFTNQELATIAANFYCESAELQESQHKAEISLKKALKIQFDCTRALMSLADFAIKNAEYAKAQKYLLKILDVDIEFSADVADKLEHCYIHQNKEKELYELLKQKADEEICVAFSIKYAKYIERYESSEHALDFMIKALQHKPNIRAFIKLLELTHNSNKSTSEILDTVKLLVNEYLKTKALYNCRSCGFNSNHRYWQCPSCHTWGSIKPSKGLDGR